MSTSPQISQTKAVGRPSILSDELTDAICREIMAGHSVRSICKRDGFPSEDTVYRWIGTNEAFSEKYARAKQICMLRMEEELLEIADDGSNDLMTIEKGDVSYEVENKEVVNRSRLRVDTRKWLMSKLVPKKYGDFRPEATGGTPVAQIIIMAPQVEPRKNPALIEPEFGVIEGK